MVTCGYVANGPLTFDAQKDATYYVQASDWYSGGTTLDFVYSFIDTVSPTITFAGNAATDAVDGRVVITATADDDVDPSALLSCSLTNDAGGAVVSTSCAFDAWAWELGLGHFTFTATATDNAGNAASDSIAFEVVATYPSMSSLTKTWVEKAGVAKDLVALLDSALAAENRGQLRAEAGKLADYRALLRAQAGKSITPERAQLLTTFSYGL